MLLGHPINLRVLATVTMKLMLTHFCYEKRNFCSKAIKQKGSSWGYVYTHAQTGMCVPHLWPYRPECLLFFVHWSVVSGQAQLCLCLHMTGNMSGSRSLTVPHPTHVKSRVLTSDPKFWLWITLHPCFLWPLPRLTPLQPVDSHAVTRIHLITVLPQGLCPGFSFYMQCCPLYVCRAHSSFHSASADLLP